MDKQILIRKEKKDDYKEIHHVNLVAFGQENEAKLVEDIRKNPNIFIPELSLVAISDQLKLVGHILFSKINIKSETGKAYESLSLAPMAVLPEFQKQGIGGMMVKEGLKRAKELGYDSVIVLGHKEYYPKFGFKPAKLWDIIPSFEVPSEVFMALELKESVLQQISGTVYYPKEFGID